MTEVETVLLPVVWTSWDIVDETDCVDKDIDNQHQTSFTLAVNTKLRDDTSANYGFLNRADFTIDPVEEITRRDESCLVDKIDFLDIDIHN